MDRKLSDNLVILINFPYIGHHVVLHALKEIWVGLVHLQFLIGYTISFWW